METVNPNRVLLHRADRLRLRAWTHPAVDHLAARGEDPTAFGATPDFHHGLLRPTVSTDADLVREALDGSERAFRELVCRYERPVFSVLTRLISNPSRAEELAQDTFVKAFQHLHTYEPDRKFGAWLLAIAHHAGVDELRRARIEPKPLDEAFPTYAAIPDVITETPAAAAERAELAHALDAAIRRLRPEYAELVALRYEEELTLDEIGDITALPIGTIKSYLHRARKELAGFLTAAGWRPER